MKKKTRFIAFVTVIFLMTAAVCFAGGISDVDEDIRDDIRDAVRGIIGGSGASGGSAPNTGSGSSGTNVPTGAPLPAAIGKLTITGIPSSLNGKYAMLSVGTIGENVVLVGFEGVTGSDANASLTLSRIANGRVSIPVYISRNSGDLAAYQGNDTADTLMIVIMNDSPVTQARTTNIANYLAVMTCTSVKFSRGNKELAWSGMLLR